MAQRQNENRQALDACGAAVESASSPQGKIVLSPDMPLWGKLQVKIAKSPCSAEEALHRLISNYKMTVENVCLMLKQSGKVKNDEEFKTLLNSLAKDSDDEK